MTRIGHRYAVGALDGMQPVGPSSSNSDTPPKDWSISPVCTRRIRLPSLTQALLWPAKLTSANLLVVFSRLASCASGGATYSPTPYIVNASVSPAIPTGQAILHTDTPEARVTTSSLPAARLPRPMSAPIIAAIGSSSKICSGRLRKVNRNASPVP